MVCVWLKVLNDFLLPFALLKITFIVEIMMIFLVICKFKHEKAKQGEEYEKIFFLFC